MGYRDPVTASDHPWHSTTGCPSYRLGASAMQYYQSIAVNDQQCSLA